MLWKACVSCHHLLINTYRANFVWRCTRTYFIIFPGVFLYCPFSFMLLHILLCNCNCSWCLCVISQTWRTKLYYFLCTFLQNKILLNLSRSVGTCVCIVGYVQCFVPFIPLYKESENIIIRLIQNSYGRAVCGNKEIQINTILALFIYRNRITGLLFFQSKC